MAKPTPELPNKLLSLTILHPYLDVQRNTPYTIAILGIGGKGGHRLASYYHSLGCEVIGFDIKENDNIRRLREIGVNITLGNPENEIPADIVIYSFNIPEKIRDSICKTNKTKPFLGIENILRKLGTLLRKGKLTRKETRLAQKHHIAPLVNLNFDGITFIGVTGTDGKTTSSELLHHVLQKMGHKTGVISTVQTKIGNKVIVSDPHVTTPSSDEVAAILTKMQKAHCTHIIIEASSQGLVSDRLIGIQFDTVTITNVTAEHLDFHKTWINYLNAKKVILKEFLKPKGIAILNADDRSFKKLCNVSASARCYSIATNKAYYHASNIKYQNAKTTFNLTYLEHKYQVTISLPGEYNVSNTLGVIGILDSIGIDIPTAIPHFASFKGSRGRMQVIQHLPYTVIVDFAHTPNGLQNALKAAALYKSRTDNKIIGIVGCSGSRDPYKRVVMGRIAHDIADITIIAPVNPRNECQKSINLQVITGWKHGYNLKENKELYVSDLYELPTENRRDAFRQALKIAEPGDVVIATGKGHQNDICDNHNTYEWSDIEELQKLLNETS